MARTFWGRRDGHVILPSNRASALAIEDLPSGDFRVEVTVPRNPRRHRLFFALMSLTAKALNDGPTPTRWTAEDVAENVKIALGHVEVFKLRPADARRYGTDTALRPKSISFAAMGDEEFSPFMESAFDYIRDDLAPWINGSDYWSEILQIVGEAQREDAA